MKRLLFALLISLVFYSCQEKDKKAIAIKKKVVENAFGQDIGYKAILTEKKADVSYKDILDIFIKEFDAELKPIDSLIYYTNKAKESQRKAENVETYHFLDFYYKRLKKYKTIEVKSNIAYSVYKHKYSIINPMFNNAKVEVVNYYFFSPKDSLIGYVDESEFNNFKKQFIKHDKQYLETLYRKIENK